uniref:Uncharacterized protein n=1 Tax=Cacopsylla melanoneura TaxID=428564 RepID=A0A8D9BRG9_9HEMI
MFWECVFTCDSSFPIFTYSLFEEWDIFEFCRATSVTQCANAWDFRPGGLVVRIILNTFLTIIILASNSMTVIQITFLDDMNSSRCCKTVQGRRHKVRELN